MWIAALNFQDANKSKSDNLQLLLCSEFANVILFIVSSERFSYMKDASRLKYIFDL